MNEQGTMGEKESTETPKGITNKHYNIGKRIRSISNLPDFVSPIVT